MSRKPDEIKIAWAKDLIAEWRGLGYRFFGLPAFFDESTVRLRKTLGHEQHADSHTNYHPIGDSSVVDLSWFLLNHIEFGLIKEE